MSTVIALFNNKGGVGKTTLAYHLSHMASRLGFRVLAVDLDPQANLTSAFFEEPILETFWEPQSSGTILSAVSPLIRQTGDVDPPDPKEAAENLWVIPGDLGLSSFEDRLSEAWPRSFSGDEGSVRVTTAFHRVIEAGALQVGADIVFLNVGPNLGAINRAALLPSDALLVPLAADLFSLQGLRNLGPTLRSWREQWQSITLQHLPSGVDAPAATMRPIGYVVMQHAVRLDRPVKAYDRWLRRIPSEFHGSVLGEDRSKPVEEPDPYQLSSLRNYRSLMPLAQDARKPMFDLRAADGALGSTGTLVRTCYQDFRQLTLNVAKAAQVARPVPS